MSTPATATAASAGGGGNPMRGGKLSSQAAGGDGGESGGGSTLGEAGGGGRSGAMGSRYSNSQPDNPSGLHLFKGSRRNLFLKKCWCRAVQLK